MARISFVYNSYPLGIVLRLVERRLLGGSKNVPSSDWVELASEEAFSGLSRILALGDEPSSGVEIRDEDVFVPHPIAASLSEPQALRVGLPPSIKMALQIDTKGLITSPDFRLSYRWIDDANRSIRGDRKGVILSISGGEYRLPEPLFGLIEAIDEFASSPGHEDAARMASLARLQELIPGGAEALISVDSYLSSFRVLHATAFSLNLKVEGGSFHFDPILFGRRVSERGRGPDDEPVSETESLLNEHQQDIFANERFRNSDSAKTSYIVERGVYVHLDPSLRQALTIVRCMQSADPEKRKRFAQSPQLYLKEELSGVLSDSEVEHLFIETEQYSERVLDVGVWSPPVLPWIKQEPNDWLPEKFGLQIGDQYVVLEKNEIVPLRDLVKDARVKGEPFVEFGAERTRIPASSATEESLSQLLGAVQPTRQEIRSGTNPQTQEGSATERKVLIVEENFETLGFKRKALPRMGPAPHVPAAARPALKKHQHGGLSWLQEMWTRGHPGALLADDMGLGKTLQGLAFLAWLSDGGDRHHRKFRMGPILVVAPTGLLANWEKEHNEHLHAPGLGVLCRAYGRHLALLKTASTRELDLGAPSLDTRRLQQASWVVTTYETLRDYHMSFAAVPFACAVFDEMQKVKSPSSLLTQAAKTVNADFIVGLTGTPIENRLADLWCIMDIVSPGYLGDLRSFSERYQADDYGALSRLHSVMLERSADEPAPMLRRMKATELDGLPVKKIHVRKRPMPERQAGSMRMSSPMRNRRTPDRCWKPCTFCAGFHYILCGRP